MKKLTEIWIVEGSTGEYEDNTDWIICAYPDVLSAKQHVEFAQLYANEFFSEVDISLWRDLEKYKNPYDPDGRMDYTGTFYRYYSVKLLKGFVA